MTRQGGAAEAPITIHVVDDEPSIRVGLERLLRASGFEVVTCGSPEEFLVGADDRGCLILDFEMPGMNGLDVQKALIARGAQWQIIFLSGRYDAVELARQPAMEAGAVAVLEKPATAGTLLGAIEVALERLGVHAPRDGSGLRE